jgi:hypothetical protein
MECNIAGVQFAEFISDFIFDRILYCVRACVRACGFFDEGL